MSEASMKVEAVSGGNDSRPSQSLFQVYYLGCSLVDRRCSSSVLPWIIEEHKLKTEEMKLLWLTPGEETISYVADCGQELLTHPYTSILQCCIAADGISLAYIARNGMDNKYYCHVFQALTYEEAESIMAKFKVHAREEVSIGPTISRDRISDLPMKSSGFIFSSSLKHHPPDSGPPKSHGSEYHVQFLGKYEVPPTSSAKESQVQTIDRLVSNLKETQKKINKGKRGLGSLLRGKLTSSTSITSLQHSNSSDTADSTSENDSISIHSSLSNRVTNVSPEVPSSTEETSSTEHAQKSTSIGHAQSSSTQNNNYQRQISEQEIDPDPEEAPLGPEATRNDSIVSDISMEFDIIPELATLQDTAVFQSLSTVQTSPGPRVRLVFSGTALMLLSEESGERVMKKSIRNISSCAQGKKDPDYFAFTGISKEGGEKKYYLHLFQAESKKEAVKILESFKASFVHALAFGMPAALCDSCPLQKLHTLCKNLEGVSTQVGQAIIQECVHSLPDADYTSIMNQYKYSEHADHEYTQIIILVSLIRQYFQQCQNGHTHPGTSTLPPSQSSQDTAPTKLLPALTRAKNAIASSFENLKNKQAERSSRFTFRSKSPVPLVQNLPSSSLFSKKTALDTLLAPIPTSPVKTEEEVRRERTWSGYVHKSPRLSPEESLKAFKTSVTKSDPHKDDSLPTTSTRTIDRRASTPTKKTTFNIDEEKSLISPLETTPIRKVKSQRNRSLINERPTRHSTVTGGRWSTLTPPPPENKYRTHRRIKSTAPIPSWRQEMFASCSTPERRHNSSASASEIIEQFEIIDIDQYGPTWQLSKTSLLQREEKGSPRTLARSRWRKAIQQQIILNKMEEHNTIVKKASCAAEVKRQKLSYSNSISDHKQVLEQWNTLLSQPDTISEEELRKLVFRGVPPRKRAEVWPLLTKCYQTRTDPDWMLPPEVSGANGLQHLLEGETEYEHNIVVDLARTFPREPYFKPGLGQISLKNVLHSYAVADKETGYCQGLSFVTGILLMHSDNDEAAFERLYQLMMLYNYREIYFENLTNLQMRLYQLSRLLHDYQPTLYQHLKENDITPFFYAAPWFLTIFASEFPIAFTSRIFDVIFYEGTDFILKVVLALLQTHEASILACDGMEMTCKYLKSELPKVAIACVDKVFERAAKYSFESRLPTFEAEYHMMAELNSSFKADIFVDDFQSVAEVLKNQNVALIEQLAICHASNNRLMGMVETLQTQMAEQNQRIAELEAKLQSMQSSSRTSTEDEQSRSSRESLTIDRTQNML